MNTDKMRGREAVMQSIPAILVTGRIINRGGVRVIRVTCPFCHKEHTHGWPKNSLKEHRASHCDSSHGYIIVTE